MSTTTATAYSAGAAAWADGPMRVYGPLAAELVARCPIDLRGRTVLDHGAGTGAVSSAASEAQVVAVDNAIGMLLDRRASRPPAAIGDALALPFRSGAFAGAIAAFALNHLVDASAGVREIARVAREYVLVSTFAADDYHPVKRAVDGALIEAGWSSPVWYRESVAWMRRWGSVDGATATVELGGLVPERVEHARVPFPELDPRDLVRWRLGMAQCATFVSSHDERAIEARALELLGDAEPLVRSVIFITARVR
ncbi:MAG: class I SAM-dependent methyltransferase [Acidimicrobiales bacterium]